MPATRTATTTQGNASTDSKSSSSSQSWWQYVSSAALSYVGRQPRRQYQSMLDPELFINHRKKEFEEMQERIRKAEERQKQKEWADQVAAQVQQLGDSLPKAPPAAQQPTDSAPQWRDVLRSTIHDPYTAAAAVTAKRPSSSSPDDIATKKASKRAQKATSNPECNKENSVKDTNANNGLRNGRYDLTKDHFQQNFKTDASRDAENIKFITAYTGWTMTSLAHNFREQRFPKLREHFPFNRTNDEIDIAKLAEILSDRAFLKRHGLNDQLTFVSFWGNPNRWRPNLPKIYIPSHMTEPNPSRRVRKFLRAEREEMHEHMNFSELKEEWSNQTLYDLEFRLPSDPPLQPRDVELPQEPFEVHRDDPRFRHLWKLLPCVRIKSYDRSQNASQARLQYKRQISKRDLWYWKLIHAVARHDRSLAKVFTRYDLNRKRGEMYWDGYKRVELIQTDDLPNDLEVEEEDLIIRDEDEDEELVDPEIGSPDKEEPKQRTLPGYTISQTYLPNAVGKSREGSKPAVRLLPPEQRRPATFKSYTPYSTKAWENDEADLSDEDNFPSAQGYRTDYTANGEAYHQAQRLTKALAKGNLLPNGTTTKKNKKVSFAQGHTLTLFDPQEAETAASSPETHTIKKRKATDGESLKVEKSPVSSPPTENRKLANTVANIDTSNIPATKPSVPATFTRPATIGQGSSNPNKRRYQDSFSEAPREWRSLENCFSAWDEDSEDAGIFFEIDIKDGRLPKGIGNWEAELRQTRGPKRVRVLRLHGGDQDFVVWDQDGVLRDPDWVPAPTQEETAPVPEARPPSPVKMQPPPVPAPSTNVAAAAAPVPRPDQLPDLSAALRGLVKPKTLDEERAEYRAKTQSDSAEQSSPKGKGKGRQAYVSEDDENPFAFKATYAKYQRELEKEQKEKEAAAKAKKAATEESSEEDEPTPEERERGLQILESLERISASQNRNLNLLDEEEQQDDQSWFPNIDSGDNPPPRKARRRVEKSSIEIDPSFPIFNPFETAPAKPRSGLKRNSSSKSENALPSPPLSGDEGNSGKEGSPPGSKAKARLTGLFDPVQSQKAPFTVVEDTAHAATGKVAQSFESDVTAPSSTASEPQVGEAGEESTNVLQPVVVNGASLPRQGSLSDIKSQGLLPPAPITSTAPVAPVTPSAALTAAEMGMFGAVKPSPNEKRGFDDDSGMDIDNTPQSARKTRSPKEFGLVTNASASMAESFKPTVPASFDFGSMNSKPLFGNENTTAVANVNTSTPFVFGAAPATSKPKDLFAPSGNTASSDMFLFGASTTSSAPTTFGQPTAKPADTPFVFGGKATATPVSTGLFGSAAPAPAAAPSIFGASTSAPTTFGTSAPAIGGIFGASTTAPSQNMFGAASNAPTSNGLFGAVSGVTPTPSFGSAPASSASLFGAQTSTATHQPFNVTSAPNFGGNTNTTSSSFTFGSNATSQPGPFGPELTKQPSASFTSGFNFGSGTNSPAPGGNFTFGAPAASNAASPAPSAPVFGASNPATPTPTPAPMGGAGDPANLFGFQPQQTNSFGRTIKTAVSRKPGSVRGRR
ncbi:hypothetical protein TWF696_004942 [Orbilia brochopaga]